MIDGLKPYPEYKDSGMPWLGEVPGHWAVRQLGRFGLLAKGNGGNKDDEVPNGVPCVRYGDLYTQYRFSIDRTRSCVSPERATGYTPIRYGDVLFAASGETIEEIGKSAVNLLRSPAVCGGDVLRYTPSIPVNPRFLGYACDCPSSVAQKSLMGRGFTVMHIYGSQLKSLSLALPPLPEQAAIVRFLDHADRRIRRYIRAKQRLIKLLEEQKQAIIHRAVTRGLDPKVRLKPSGVEWLGDVPEHWDQLLLGRCLQRIEQGWSPVAAEGELAADQWAVLTLSSVKRGIFDAGAIKPVPISARIPESIEIKDGDLLLTRSNTRERVGDVCLVLGARAKTLLCDLIYRLTPQPTRFDSRFLMYQLLGPFGRRQIEIDARGSSGTMPKISQRHIRSWTVIAPPLEEQVTLVNEIENTTKVIVEAARRARTEIDLLREYRTRLIADVVTGKLDVREASARLPDETAEPEPPDETEVITDGEGEPTEDLDTVSDAVEA